LGLIAKTEHFLLVNTYSAALPSSDRRSGQRQSPATSRQLGLSLGPWIDATYALKLAFRSVFPDWSQTLPAGTTVAL